MGCVCPGGKKGNQLEPAPRPASTPQQAQAAWELSKDLPLLHQSEEPKKDPSRPQTQPGVVRQSQEKYLVDKSEEKVVVMANSTNAPSLAEGGSRCSRVGGLERSRCLQV